MTAVWSVVAIGLFNSIMFPNIFTLGIRGMGPLTGKASSLLIMAIVGGAVVPLAQGALADASACIAHSCFRSCVISSSHLYGLNGWQCAACRARPRSPPAPADPYSRRHEHANRRLLAVLPL